MLITILSYFHYIDGIKKSPVTKQYSTVNSQVNNLGFVIVDYSISLQSFKKNLSFPYQQHWKLLTMMNPVLI